MTEKTVRFYQEGFLVSDDIGATERKRIDKAVWEAYGEDRDENPFHSIGSGVMAAAAALTALGYNVVDADGTLGLAQAGLI